ncbi:AraC family transcriptional regulator ligand-binding domain-containing protein [Allohahella marinimesophila]|uniref:HTH-type transcriptional regulator AraC-type N-terminal domain-containing protein n=1 Tax=Allohahella marinimesophila TaxID=1054972 RepID=A0ABP7PGU9_9GAMM
MQSPFLLTSWVSSCLNGLRLRGWCPEQLFRIASVDPALLQQPTFPAHSFNVLLETARTLHDAPDVGIEARRGITPGSLLSVGLAVMSCRNLREGLDLMVKFNAGLTSCFELSLAEHGERTSFGLHQGLDVTEPYP